MGVLTHKQHYEKPPSPHEKLFFKYRDTDDGTVEIKLHKFTLII
jgi:hypothetical protein